MPKHKKMQKASEGSVTDPFLLFQDLMDAVPDVIYFKDMKGRFLFVNRAFARGLDLAPGDIIGKKDADLFPKARADRMARDDAAVMTSGRPIVDKIEHAIIPDGVNHYVSTTKVPRLDAQGKIIGLIGIARDVTARVRGERLRGQHTARMKTLAIMEDFERIKSEFISTVSHELRTPLAAATQLMLLVFDETAGPLNDRQREILARTKNNLEHLKNIINNLLDISRIEGKGLRLHYSLSDLRDIFKESEEFFRSLAREKNITLRYSFPKEDVTLFLDVERVCQVVSNLVYNALKFTGEGGRVSVEVKLLETKVRVGVADTGIGIAKKDIGRIFDKFVQAAVTESERRKGVGLGLSIAREIVERHGGEIWVESKAGVGSKFYFTLPRFYAADILEKPVKDKVQAWLDAGAAVHFINLLIVHYDEDLRRRVDEAAPQLTRDVADLMDKALKKIPGVYQQKQMMVVSDTRHGKYSILVGGASAEQIADLCRALKQDMKRYFIRHKIEDVFIAVGVGDYGKTAGAAPRGAAVLGGSIQETYVGSEMRRFKRIPYKTTVRVTVPGHKEVPCRTVDISEGGLCVISRKRLKTDARVPVVFQLVRTKKPIYAEARVSWIYKIPRQAGDTAVRYKIGLEFLGLSGEFKEDFMKELRLYHG